MYLISDLLKAYLNDRDLKPSTRQSYGVACRALIRQIGDCIVEEIDRNTVTQWRRDVLRITLNEVSWNTYMRHLRGLYQFGLDTGLIGLTKNPFDDSNVRCPKRPKKTTRRLSITPKVYWRPQKMKKTTGVNVVTSTLPGSGLRSLTRYCLPGYVPGS